MKIVLIANDPSIFDPESPTRVRLRKYAELMGTVHVISRSNDTSRTIEEQSIKEGGLSLHAVRGTKLQALRTIERTAHALIQQEGIEIVSAQDPFEYGRAARSAARGTKAKLHIQIHTDFRSPWFVKGKSLRAPQVHMPTLNRIRRLIADEVLPHADGIRVVSERVKNSVVERYGERIVMPSVIPIAIDTEVPPSIPLPPHSFTFTLMTVGRLEPEKRIEDIIAALARVARPYASVGLMVVGEGRSRSHLEVMATKLGLQDRVLFLGARADAWGLMQSAQAYIQASAYEGYGRTLLEAALARIPIITTDVGIVGEVFKGYEDVLSVPPGDPAALALSIAGLVEDVQARKSLVMSAELKARTHLSAFLNLPELIANDYAQTIARV